MGRNNLEGGTREVQIISNAYGVTSVHNNLPKQTYQESMLGYMRCEGENDDWFFYLVKTNEKFGPFDNYDQGRRALIKAVGGYLVQ